MIGWSTVMVIGVPGAAVVAGTVRSTIGGVAVMTLAAPSAEEAGGVVVPLTTTVRGFSVGVAFAFAFLLGGLVGRVFFLVPDGFVGTFVFFVLDGFVGTCDVLAASAAAVLDGVVDTAGVASRDCKGAVCHASVRAFLVFQALQKRLLSSPFSS